MARNPKPVKQRKHVGKQQATRQVGERERPVLWVLLGLHIFCLFSLVLAMTPLTHNLDDIKYTLHFIYGSVLMLSGVGVLIFYPSLRINRFIAGTLALYTVIYFLSAILSEYHWITFFYVKFHWAALGFFLIPAIIGMRRWSAEVFIRYLVIQLLVVNLIGFFMYAWMPNDTALVGLLFEWLYGNKPPSAPGTLQTLLYTLSTPGAKGSMQATILNRDFYAAFCLLYFPFGLLMIFDPGSTRRPTLWRVLGAIAALLAALSIFYCRSKGEYIFGFLTFILYIPIAYLFGNVPHLRRRHLAAGLIGLVVLLGVLTWLNSPLLRTQLKSLDVSVTSRSIIWGGSYEIFQDHQVIGGGPGTFRIYFPQYRAPDYFNHEISNVTLFSHNLFLDVLSETGILGFITFVLFLLSVGAPALYFVFRHPDYRLRMLLLTVLAGLFGMLGSNLSSPNGRWPIGASSLWTVLGLACGLTTHAMVTWRANQKSKAEAGASITGLSIKHPASAMLMVLGVVAVVFVPVNWSLGERYFRSNVHHVNALHAMEYAYRYSETPIRDQDALATVYDLLERSIQEFNRAIEIWPHNISSYYKLASNYSTFGNLKQIYEDNSEHAMQYAMLGKETYERITQFWPDYAEIHYNLGIVYETYADHLRKAAAQAEETRASQMLEEAKRHEQLALDHLEQMDKMSQKVEVAILLGREYKAMGYPEKAAEVYRKAHERYPENKQILVAWNQTAGELEDFQMLALTLKEIWELEPTNNEYLNKLLSVYLNRGFDEELQAVLSQLYDMNPVDPRIHEARLVQTVREGNPQALRQNLEAYLRTGGRNPMILKGAINFAEEKGLQAEVEQLLARYEVELEQAE